MKPVPLQEQTLYSALTFRHLLDSLARPGKINQLEYPDFLGDAPLQMSVNLYALGAMLTLLDREVTFAVAADGQWLSDTAPLVQWLTLRSGSAVTAPASARFAFFCQGRSNGLVTQLHRGTLLEPESSATAFYCVEHLTDSADTLAENPQAVTLELSGPGIAATHKISVIGLDRDEIKLLNTTRGPYPLGIDIYFIDNLGHCIGLPRTTHIQQLEPFVTGLAPQQSVGTGLAPVRAEGKER